MKYVLSMLAVAAAVYGFTLARDAEPESREFEIGAALADEELNADLAESAPQQQVVNGWVARDLLRIQATQLDDILTAQQQVMFVTAMVGVVVALSAAAVVAAVSRRPAPDLSVPAPAASDGPDA